MIRCLQCVHDILFMRIYMLQYTPAELESKLILILQSYWLLTQYCTNMDDDWLHTQYQTNIKPTQLLLHQLIVANACHTQNFHYCETNFCAYLASLIGLSMRSYSSLVCPSSAVSTWIWVGGREGGGRGEEGGREGGRKRDESNIEEVIKYIYLVCMCAWKYHFCQCA